ncbi:MAG: sigma-70 family RNA polymerase sigma factor [Candidatus Tyrphobacter sp.]
MPDRDARVRALLPLVRRIARRVHRVIPRADLGDLIGDGSVGLVRAVDAYDPSRGTTLEYFARKLIVGAMLNGLRRLDSVPERVRRTARLGERERYTLAVMHGTLPSTREMARRYPGFERAECAAYRSLALSLDAPLPIGERLTPDAGADPACLTADNDERAYLQSLVCALPERQRRLLLAHYYGAESLRRIGAAWNISSQRASQIHIAAIARLRKAFYAASRRV